MGNNSGGAGAKNNAMTKRGRFNTNPTSCNHPSCMIAARAKTDKKIHEKAVRKVITFISNAGGIFGIPSR